MFRRLASRSERGFALFLVLWILVLISFLVMQIAAAGRTEIRIARNLLANSVAKAAADGAIYEAIYHLLDPSADNRWVLDDGSHELAIGTARVTVRLEDEASWINPSLASPELLEALFSVTGSDPKTAHRLAAAITEWVGSAPVARPIKDVLSDYQAAGRDYGPPGSALESLDELQRVIGLTSQIYARIRPHLTLFGPGQPSRTSQDPFVLAAIADPSMKEAPPSASPPPDVLTIRIVADAFGEKAARVDRVAIVRIGAVYTPGYEILAWGDDAD